MRYASANAFRTALETRLCTQAQETGLPLVRLRKAVVFDWILARLLIAAEGRWILKGGLALDYRFGSRTRTTKDDDWADPYRKLAAEIGIDPAIDAGFSVAQALLDPILAVSIDDKAHWSPQHSAWII